MPWGSVGAWLAIAAAETLLGGGQDALNNVGMIQDNYVVITTAGMLHGVAGMLLIVGLTGVAPLVWASGFGRVGWFLSMTLTAGLGSFAMLHLLALETAAAGLDGAAMSQWVMAVGGVLASYGILRSGAPGRGDAKVTGVHASTNDGQRAG